MRRASSPRGRVNVLLAPEPALRLEHFVREREQEDGGFGLTPLMPATVEDTFQAIRILEMLGKDQDLDRTRSYVFRIDWNISRRSKTIFEILYLKRKFGFSLPSPATWQRIRSNSLEDAYFRWKIVSLMQEEDRISGLEPEFRLNHRKPRRRLSVKNLYYYLGLPHVHYSRQTRARWLEWTRASQNPDGGFGIRPGTTSYLDYVPPALGVLWQLGGAPVDCPGLLRFILACQTRTGGFARTGGGASFLRSSYHAMQALQYLGRWYSQKLATASNQPVT